MAALDRRALFAIASAATLLPAAAMAAPAPTASALSYAVRESAALQKMARGLDWADDAEAEAWAARDDRFLAWAENLPLTPENAKVKALVFQHIYADGVDEFIDGAGTTVERLALQIIKCVLGGLN